MSAWEQEQSTLIRETSEEVTVELRKTFMMSCSKQQEAMGQNVPGRGNRTGVSRWKGD